ncbi:signal transducation histidine kinase [Haloferula helveola]|uniref:Signal transducation histidine kinase n=1 Tax=Haloferula helveola TaxID=490095 RepID=A0ABN6H750_9BACT|nr:signal transducation histidine kinase [Haloferula helveola]
MKTSKEPSTPLTDLDCENQAIHLIGRLQHGKALVAINLPAGRFSHASEGTESITGYNLELHPDEWLGNTQIVNLLRRTTAWKGRGPMPVVIEPLAGAPIQGWAYLSETRLVLEWDPTDEVPGMGDDWDLEIRECLERIESTEELDAKIETVTSELRRLCGFDRVMIYRFLHDFSGEVIAESRRDDWEPYLGLRYPAGDIPKPARDLFLRNDLRLIGDVSAASVPIHGEGDLDMSLSRYRQPADVHIEYLKNMGVAASLVTSVRVGSELWGLISCHHGSPRTLSAKDQSRIATLTGHLAVDLSGAAREKKLRSDLACARLANKLVQCVTLTTDWPPVMMSIASEVIETLRADGLALRFGGTTRTHGEGIDAAWVDRLVEAYGKDRRNSVGASDRAPADFPDAGLPPSIGGVLWIPLSNFRNDALLIFRKAQDISISWAGDPARHTEMNDEGKLGPRRSFAIWKENVRGCGEPWSEAELDMASTVRSTLIDIVITTQTFREIIETPAARRFRIAHHDSENALIFADPEGKVVYANPKALDGELASITHFDQIALWQTDDGTPPLADLTIDDGPRQFRRNGTEFEFGTLRDEGELVGYSLRIRSPNG